MVKKIFCAAAAFAIVISSQSLQAQTSPSEMQEATVAFDFRMKKLRDGKFMKMLDVEEQLKAMTESADVPGDFDMTKVDRIFGAIALPDDVATFEQMAGSDKAPENLPMDMFVKLKFGDSETAKAMFEDMEAKSEKVELGGKTYLKPPASEGIQNMIVHMPASTTIEMGTRNYLLQSKRTELFSPGLAAGWKKVPDHAIRIAIDIKGESQLISQAVAMGKENSGTGQQAAMTNAYLDLIDNAENVRISLDFDSPNILVIAATGVDDSQAEELRSGLDAIMGMAKMGGKMGIQQAGPMVPPNMAKVANSILDSLKATAEGKEVKVAIPKPEGFDEAIKGVVDQVKQMQQMGAPPQGGDGF